MSTTIQINFSGDTKLDTLINDYLIAFYIFKPTAFTSDGYLIKHTRNELTKLMVTGDQPRLLELIALGNSNKHELGITTEVAGGRIFRVTFELSDEENPTLSLHINNQIIK